MVCKWSLVERLDLLPMAVLLMIGGKLPAQRAKSAHFVGHLPGTTSLYDREGVYSVRQFVTYEKELCLAGEACDCPGESAETLIEV